MEHFGGPGKNHDLYSFSTLSRGGSWHHSWHHLSEPWVPIPHQSQLFHKSSPYASHTRKPLVSIYTISTYLATVTQVRTTQDTPGPYHLNFRWLARVLPLHSTLASPSSHLLQLQLPHQGVPCTKCPRNIHAALVPATSPGQSLCGAP